MDQVLNPVASMSLKESHSVKHQIHFTPTSSAKDLMPKFFQLKNPNRHIFPKGFITFRDSSILFQFPIK